MNKKGLVFLIAIVLIVILIGSIIVSNRSSAAEFIKNSDRFDYTTSITSSFERDERANVYISKMPVIETAKYIISKTRPESYSDISNDEHISILYDNEYVFVYKGEDDKTYIQVSSREYAYRGSRSLYRSRHGSAFTFFRDYYFLKGLLGDRDRYRGRSYYDQKNYKPSSTFKKNIQNKSHINRNSGFGIKRGSSGTRKSIGGGTSFGK